MEKALPKFISYILLKWVVFYIYQFIPAKTDWQLPDMEGFVFAVLVLIFLPLLEIIVLAFPFYFGLKARGFSQLLLFSLAFGIEFVLNWYATSQSFQLWMLVKLVLSMGLFVIFYRKQLRLVAF